MIRWNKARKQSLVIFSAVWVILILGGSIHIYPEKRNDHNFGEKELVDLFAKKNKTHEENIAVLMMLKKGKIVDLNKEGIEILRKESIASLSFSIIQHQRKYNKKKQRSIEFLFLGLATLLGVWGILYFISEKKC